MEKLFFRILLFIFIGMVIFHFIGVNLIRPAANAPDLCVFKRITHIPCPGCGMTRSFIYLSQFKLVKAIKMNPFSIFLFILMIIFSFGNDKFINNIKIKILNKIVMSLVLTIILGYWILKILILYRIF